jgi:hypothetical protein
MELRASLKDREPPAVSQEEMTSNLAKADLLDEQVVFL